MSFDFVNVSERISWEDIKRAGAYMSPEPMVTIEPENMVKFLQEPTPLVTFQTPDSEEPSLCGNYHGFVEPHNKTTNETSQLLSDNNLLTISHSENKQADTYQEKIFTPENQVKEVTSLSNPNKVREAQDDAMINIITSRPQSKENTIKGSIPSIEINDFYYNGRYLYIDGRTLCNFTIILTEEIVMINANSLTSFSKYKVRVTVNMQTFEGTILGEELDQLKWVKRLTSGKSVLISDLEDYRLYILHLVSSPISKRTYVYDRSGWIPLEKQFYYVTDKGLIGCVRPDITTNDNKEFIYDSNKVGTDEIYHKILELMNFMCKDREISILLVLFTHLSVLTTPFIQAGYPPKFVMGLIGETNSRKTSMATALTQIFSRNKPLRPEISFTSTQAGIETRLQTYSDAVLLVDDLMPANTSRQQYENISKLEFLVRAYGDHVSKVRMTDFSKTGSQESYPIRGCCLITGEYIEGICSSMTRMVILNIDKHQVNNQLLSYHQKNSYILSTHFYDFLSFISENYESTVSYIQNRMEPLRKQASTYFGTPRFAESYAHLQTVSEIFLKYGVNRGFIRDYEYDTYISNFEVCIRKVISENDLEVTKKNIGVMFLVALRSSINSGKVKGIALDDPLLTNEDFVYSDEEHIYIQLSAAFLLAKKYWNNFGKYLPITTDDQLLQYLIPLGVVVAKPEGKKIRHTHRLPRRKTGDNTRYLYIIKAVMDEKLSDVQTL